MPSAKKTKKPSGSEKAPGQAEVKPRGRKAKAKPAVEEPAKAKPAALVDSEPVEAEVIEPEVVEPEALQELEQEEPNLDAGGKVTVLPPVPVEDRGLVRRDPLQ